MITMFGQVEAQPVFEIFEHRRLSDEATMAELGPNGFARRDEFLLPVGPDVGWFLHKLILPIGQALSSNSERAMDTQPFFSQMPLAKSTRMSSLLRLQITSKISRRRCYLMQD